MPVDQGILVAQLYRNGPAIVAGIRGANTEIISGNRRYLIGGDIITAVNGMSITDWTSLSEYLEQNTSVGDEISLSLTRECHHSGPGHAHFAAYLAIITLVT